MKKFKTPFGRTVQRYRFAGLTQESRMGFLIMLKVNRSVAIVPRDLAEMREVSLAAKGLYALLQMNDDIISLRVLSDRYGIGHEFAEQCFEELLKSGFVDIIFGSDVVFVINQ